MTKKIIGFVFLLAACGGTDEMETGSCDYQASDNICSEFTGPLDTVEQIKKNCTTDVLISGIPGIPGTGCIRTGSVGGCRAPASENGVTGTSFFYAPKSTIASAMQSCSIVGYTYVAP